MILHFRHVGNWSNYYRKSCATAVDSTAFFAQVVFTFIESGSSLTSILSSLAYHLSYRLINFAHL